MPDAPRDPRQLARDILSGKISIEDLAREQRRRAEARAAAQGTPARPAPAPNVPPKIPLPRPVQARPVQRQMPPVQRPTPRPPVGTPQRPTVRGPLQRPPERKPAGPNVTVGRSPATVKGPVLSAPAVAATPTTTAKPRPGAYSGPVTGGTGPLGLRSLIKDRAALRRAVVMAEILGKPLALRDE